MNPREYFQKHPEHFDGVVRATYAYHLIHTEPKAHNFYNSQRESKCIWCGQTKEGVRWNWYDSPPECLSRPKSANRSIKSIIEQEEALFEKVIIKAEKLAESLTPSELTGEDLATMHHTHGIDPSILEVALMKAGKGSLSQKLHEEYEVAYNRHRSTGKLGLKRKIITINDN